MPANGSSLHCYAMIISEQKLTQVIKSNVAGLQGQEYREYRRHIIKKHNSGNTEGNTKKTTEANWD